MSKNKHEGELWPYHQDPNGNMLPCASNPCKLHGGTEVYARNTEEATEKNYNEQIMGMDPNTIYNCRFIIGPNQLSPEALQKAGLELHNLGNTVSSFSMPIGSVDEAPKFENLTQKIPAQIVAYANDGMNEGIIIRIKGMDIPTTLSYKIGSTPRKTKDLNFKPLDKPIMLTGQVVANDKDRTVYLSGFGFRKLTKKQFQGSVNAVGRQISQDDWEYLQKFSHTVSTMLKSNRRKNEIAARLEKFLKSNDPEAVQFREYCGPDVDMHELSQIMVSNVSSMTDDVTDFSFNRFGHRRNTIKRGIMSAVHNDMRGDKEKYLTSIMFFGGRCCYCQVPLTKGSSQTTIDTTATGEHIDAINGNPPGVTQYGNVVLCCRKCNNARGNDSFDEFAHKYLTPQQAEKSREMIRAFRKYTGYNPLPAEEHRILSEISQRLSAVAERKHYTSSQVKQAIDYEISESKRTGKIRK